MGLYEFVVPIRLNKYKGEVYNPYHRRVISKSS